MNSAIQYGIESIAATGIFYFIFILFLRNKPFLGFNRFILLVMVGLGIILPIVEISLPQDSQTFANVPVSSVIVGEVVFTAADIKAEPAFQWMETVYGLVSAVLLTLLLVQVYKIYAIHKYSQLQKEGNIQVYLMENDHTHFSVFNKVFINSRLINHDEELEQVFKHEMVHVNQRHTWDILFIELCKLVLWINPFLWLFKKRMVENHEYLADRGATKTAGKNYAYLRHLVDSSLFGLQFSLVNNFDYSLVRKRLKMLTKRRIGWLEKMIVAAVFPLIVASVLFFACSEEGFETPLSGTRDDTIKVEKSDKFLDPNGIKFTSDGEKIYQFIENMPEFQGKDYNAFRDYIKDNLNYPPEAKSQGIAGRVLVRFNVSSEGKVKDVILIQGTHELLDEEALRVVKSSPDWKSGTLDGRKVAVQFTFPVMFKLNETSTQTYKPAPASVVKYSDRHLSAHIQTLKVRNDTSYSIVIFVVPKDHELYSLGLTGEVDVCFDFSEDRMQLEQINVKHSDHPKLTEAVIESVRGNATYGVFYHRWNKSKIKPTHFVLKCYFIDNHKKIFDYSAYN